MGAPLLSIIRVLLPVLLVPIGRSCGSFITVQSFKCTRNEELCLNMICNNDVSRNRVARINCGCVIPRPLYNLTVDLKLQNMRNGRFETFVSGKENMCNIANRSVRGQAIARGFESILKYFSGFDCPFQGNVTATNIPVTLSFAPGFMPATDYRVLADVKNAQEFVLGAELRFAIKKNKFTGRK